MSSTRPHVFPAPRALSRRPTVRGLATLLTLAVAWSIAAVATTGCMVMDELDTAAAKMPDAKNKKAKADPKKDPSGESLGAAGRLAAAKNALDERSQKWWQEAKTMTPGESKPDGIVRCRMPDGLRFMSKDDCIVQGGRTDG